MNKEMVKQGLAEMEAAYKAGSPFDLLMLDVQMPEMDGWEVARRIKENQHLIHTKIFVMSSVVDNIDKEQRNNLNITSFMAKPITYQEVMDELLHIFGNLEIQKAGNK